MAGPPDNIPSSELWAMLQALPRPHRVVEFPRLGPDGKAVGQVAIFVLTQEEQVASNTEAEKLSRKLLKDGKRGDLGYEAIFNHEGAVQVLYRACRDVNDVKRHAFPSPTAIRESLTADEVGMLFEHYLTVQLELGPIMSSMEEPEIQAWIEKLAEGGAFFFDLLSSDMRKVLAVSMASRLVSSSKGITCVGTPHDESSASGEDE